MCCSNRNRTRQPLLFTLGKAAYGAYRSRKANKQQQQLSEGATLSTQQNGQLDNEKDLSSAMNALNLKGGAPPSYDDVVADEKRGAKGEKASKLDFEDDSSSEEEGVTESGESSSSAGISRCEMKRMKRQQRMEAWRARKTERRFEREAKWAASGRRGCCR